jgi:hypothetical protein
MTSPNRPCNKEGAATRPVEPRLPGATTGPPSTAEYRKSAHGQCLRPPHHGCERSRLDTENTSEDHQQWAVHNLEPSLDLLEGT